MAPERWQHVGFVLWSRDSCFAFNPDRFKSRVGDLVAVRMDVPDEARKGTQAICVWGRVVSVNRFNPFFPYQAAQELSNEGLSLQDTILSTSRDQLEAGVLILGCTPAEDGFKNLYPLTYPVQPAAEVLYPPAAAIKELLAGGIPGDTELALVALFRREGIIGWRRQVAVVVALKRGSVQGLKRRRVNASPLQRLNASTVPRVNAQTPRPRVRPDFVFPALQVAVFVDGCFWHACPLHATRPKNRAAFWRQKLAANVARDRKVNRALRAAGWRVLRIWEHALAPRQEARLARRIRRVLNVSTVRR